jgi:hypothetical protein
MPKSAREILGVPRPVLLIILASLAFRIVLAAMIGAGFDEAYYYAYAQHPSLSYFDHPPVVAFLAGLFPALSGVASAFSIRLGAILLFVATSIIVYRLALRFVSAEGAFFAVLAINCCPMTILGAGTAILPDAAMAFFWVGALLYIDTIVRGEATDTDWLAAGALCGAAMLAKYHGVLLPGLLCLYVLLYRRKYLATPRPYVAALVAAVVFMPVIVWNLQHDFISFRFQGARAAGAGVSITSLLQALGAQAGYLTPMVFVPMVWIMVKTIRDGFGEGQDRERARLWFFFGTVPVLLFVLVSLFKPILPHWTLAGYLLLMVPLGELVAGAWRAHRAARVGVIATIAIVTSLLLALASHARWGALQGVVPKKGDVTLDAYGWEAVDEYLREEGLTAADVFLFTHKWYLSGEVCLATGGRYDVMCFNATDGRGYSVWDRELDQRGRDGVCIYTDRYPVDARAEYGAYFESVDDPHQVHVMRGGVDVKAVYFARCRNLLRKYPLAAVRERDARLPRAP